MRVFTLTVLDPYNEDDEVSPVEAEAWLVAATCGQPPFELDTQEGFGILLGHGPDAYRVDAFGSPGVMAAGFRAAAERLTNSRPAALRSDYADHPIYIAFLPEASRVRVVEDRQGPPGHGFPFRPSPMMEEEGAWERMQIWLDIEVCALPRSTGSMHSDRATGRLLSLDKDLLVADLHHAATIADTIVSFLNIRTWQMPIALRPPVHAQGSSPPAPPSVPQSLAHSPRSLAQIRLLHIPTDYPKIDLLRAIRATADLSLDAAKAVVAKVLAGQPVTLDCPTKEHRRALIAAGATVE